jgi:hypothetical protein
MLPRMRGSCGGATEGANAAYVQLAPLPRRAGEDLTNPYSVSAQLSPMVGREITTRDRPGNAGVRRSAK